ncbi:MAG TPA: hypothetical protein VMF31_00750 [Solirubrobacterales bacterium]|nr:hypothetical protein [Solirubrobacterales bacterium]
MTDEQRQLLQHRINEAENDIARLFERTNDGLVAAAMLADLRAEVRAMRKENTEQHAEGKAELRAMAKAVNKRIDAVETDAKEGVDSVKDKIFVGAISLAGVFAAALAGLLAKGL